MYLGCAAIARSGRPAVERSAALGVGMRMKRSRNMVRSAMPISARYAPMNFGVSMPMVQRLMVGPRMPPTRPPASTSEIAVALKSPVATSAAAKR